MAAAAENHIPNVILASRRVSRDIVDNRGR